MLRKYQQDCLDKLLWDYANNTGNALVSLPTGAGKTVIIAAFVDAIKVPTLILCPTREILTQDREKLLQCVDKSEIGTFSASMNEKTVKKYTLGTIGTIRNNPNLFFHFKVIISDECHLINFRKPSGMYMTFFNGLENKRIFGFSGTIFRQVQQYIRHSAYFVESVTMTKMINRMWGTNNKPFWDRLLYTISTQELIDQGYLVPLTYIDKKLIDQLSIPLNISKSDFDLAKYEELIWDQMNRIQYAIERCRDIYRSTLVFCSSVQQAALLHDSVQGSAMVTADTPKKERTKVVEGFKSGEIRVVFNVNCFSIGFDHSSLDCIVNLRPTRSIGLYLQQLGRGSRTAPGKKTCVVVDFTDTVKKLGKIESFRVAKIENKWNIISDKKPDGWHGYPLYRFTVDTKTV